MLKDASPKTKDLVTYMMSDGYLDWLAIAPEGKMPARSGTSANPKEYSDGWIELSAGVDKKESLTKIYPAEVLNTIVASSGNFERWGIPQGQGELAAAVAGQYVVPQALAKMLNSGASAADAANEAQKGAEQSRRTSAASRGNQFVDPGPDPRVHAIIKLTGRRAGTYEHRGAPCPQR